MAKTSYITTHGRIRGEITNGVMTRYGTDALGSVVATYSGGSVLNTYRHKPYGGLLAKIGAAVDPYFLWNGGSGYRVTSLGAAGFYIRRRHYSQSSALWTTIDPLWPEQNAFAYANGRPASWGDATGMAGGTGSGTPCISCCTPVSISQPRLLSKFCDESYSEPTCPQSDQGSNFGLCFAQDVTWNISSGEGAQNTGYCPLTWSEVWNGFGPNAVQTSPPPQGWCYDREWKASQQNVCQGGPFKCTLTDCPHIPIDALTKQMIKQMQSGCQVNFNICQTVTIGNVCQGGSIVQYNTITIAVTMPNKTSGNVFSCNSNVVGSSTGCTPGAASMATVTCPKQGH